MSPNILNLSSTRSIHNHVYSGIRVSSHFLFEKHIKALVRQCKLLSNLTMRNFTSREKFLMSLYRSIISPRLAYGCQLWSPTNISEINKIESIQSSFTKRIDGMLSINAILSETCETEHVLSSKTPRSLFNYLCVKIISGHFQT